MRTVQISPDESSVYETFRDGHPVQIRVAVRPGDENEYRKGRHVRVTFNDETAEGRIVSEPLEVESKTEDGSKTLSIIVEKP